LEDRTREIFQGKSLEADVWWRKRKSLYYVLLLIWDIDIFRYNLSIKIKNFLLNGYKPLYMLADRHK
jgi:hypothetical protein